ncbi:MAG: cytochrome c [Rhodospirillaceae bacterium]|nr:cytochrome c [Rhodospirillaceae bacterium]
MRLTSRVVVAATAVIAGWLSVARASDDLAQGAALYAEHCASCHGAELEGAPDWRRRGADGLYPAPPHDETGHTWHHGDKLLFDYTKLGGEATLAKRGVLDFESGMPGFGHLLTDDQVRDVLAFIKSTWPELMRSHQEDMTQQEAASHGEE